MVALCHSILVLLEIDVWGHDQLYACTRGDNTYLCTTCMAVGTTFSLLFPCEKVLEALAKVQAKIQLFDSKAAVTTVNGDVPSTAVLISTEAPMEEDKAPAIEAEADSASDSDL